MPRGDGTGPMGLGPMTGRAAGYCVGYGAPGFMNPIPRAGFGVGAMPYGGFGASTAMPYATPFAAGYPAWGAGYGYFPRMGFGRGLGMGRGGGFGRGRRFWY